MGSLGQENDAVGYLAFGPSDTDVLDRSATFIKVEIAPPRKLPTHWDVYIPIVGVATKDLCITPVFMNTHYFTQ